MLKRKTRQRPLACAAAALLLASSCGGGAPEGQTQFEPNWESLKTHEVSDWFHDAKLGIFIHWGLYSVPGWAKPTGELGKVDWDVWFKNNPYAEWYLNSLRIEGSPTAEYHKETYGEDFDYLDFIPQFNEAIQNWDPNSWAKLFREVGARYVVLTTKHHDGFCLWPTKVDNPNREEGQEHAARDLAGELTQAVRAEGMRMGLYYSGGLDWSFNDEPIDTIEEVRGTVIHTEEYADYAGAHWQELIDNYQPAVLWNDISYPEPGNLETLFADYYNRFPTGLVNDRFNAPHYDFTTPEYSKKDDITEEKWESCRGLGFSFGYNRMEGPEHTIPANDLIELLADIVSKNGNLLLNVGPKADGTIPEIQVERLRALGEWLSVNGEAIFSTRPWTRAAGETGSGGAVRFTQTADSLYAVLFEDDPGGKATVKGLTLPGGAQIELLGAGPVEWSQSGEDVEVELPAELPSAHAHALKITPKPEG